MALYSSAHTYTYTHPLIHSLVSIHKPEKSYKYGMFTGLELIWVYFVRTDEKGFGLWDLST